VVVVVVVMMIEISKLALVYLCEFRVC
jgi:hypothetical protein